MRVYLPTTLPQLGDIHSAGLVAGAPIRAFAVTAALREVHGGDEEELEYAALGAAADASVALLAALPAAPRRRVVLAADVDAALVDAGGQVGGPAAVALAGEVPWARLASVHVDEAQAEGDVAAAAEHGAPHRAAEHELLWYATQEIRYLLAEQR